MRLASSLAILFLAATAPAASAQEYNITQVPRLLMCSQSNLGECFAGREAVLLKQFPDIVRHDAAGTTSVKLLNGKWKPILNDPDHDWLNCWVALDMQKGDRFLTLGCVAEEEDWWKLLDRKTGMINDFYGYPYLSPDGQHVAVANQDDMNGAIFEMFGFKAGVASPMFDLMGDDRDSWWPDHLCWADNSTLIYRHVTWIGSGGGNDYERQPGYLKLKNGRWRNANGHPSDTGSCSKLVG